VATEKWHARKAGAHVPWVVLSRIRGLLPVRPTLPGWVLPVNPGIDGRIGAPRSISFVGDLFGEAALVAVAREYQRRTAWDEARPPGF